ncbi:MAG: fused MFS/spermidine synthase [Patescibacteria group bacterium]|nr:fused MFS/spermidine synthase [Patescibacteria group bacterium]
MSEQANARLPRRTMVGAAFVGGFAVMSLELLEARLAAPYFGSSVLVWTNIIGVILAALALGAWLGGVVVDRRPDIRWAAAALFGAGIWSLGMSVLGREILLSFTVLSQQVATPLASLILFAPPSLLLGAVPPVLWRMMVKNVEQSGHEAGLLSALGTIGSLVGTYLTGYVLLPRFGVESLLVMLSGVMIVYALLLTEKVKMYPILGSCFSIVMLGSLVDSVQGQLTPGKFFPSAYSHVSVIRMPWQGQDSEMLIINKGFHSGATLEDPEHTVFSYAKAAQAVEGLTSDPKSLLLVGGGGMHIAHGFLERHPGAIADVIEIDPAVYEAAKETFGTGDEAGLNIHFGDARTVVRRLDGKYDTIVVDAYGGDLSVPWHLITREALMDLDEKLSVDGVLTANVIMATNPEASESVFTRRSLATMRSVFGWVVPISMGNVTKGTGRIANVMLFAGHGDKPDAEALARSIREKYDIPTAQPFDFDASDALVYTDDYGPGDYDSARMYVANKE